MSIIFLALSQFKDIISFESITDKDECVKILEKCKFILSRVTFSHDLRFNEKYIGYSFDFLIRGDYVYFCVSKGIISRESVKFCLNEMETADKSDMNKTLRSLLQISNDDKLKSVRLEIQETEKEMGDNIISIIDRGNKINEIREFSNNLLHDSEELFDNSIFIRREMIKKRICYISTAVCVLGTVLAIAAFLYYK